MPDVTHGRYGHAIDQALRAAAVRPEEISLITPHGLGTGLFDRFEAMSLASVFGNGSHAAPWPPLMLLKGAVGHTLGGCVLIETAASLLALAKGEIPATIERPIRAVLDGSFGHTSTRLDAPDVHERLRRAERRHRPPPGGPLEPRYSLRI
jgi:3-oxoacyl-(acyl-carrier-protein) synthase